MAAVWPLQMPSSAKAVLISLADNANDDGYCFPSIHTISERVCLGRTAVIDAIKWLEQHGALKADRSNGRHTTYTLTPGAFTNPSAIRTGDQQAHEPNQSAKRTGPDNKPVRQADGTSPESGRDQSAKRTLTVKEPSRNRKEGDAQARPPDVPERAWSDWLAVRKAKRSGPVTDTALAGMRREAAKAGISLDDAVRICAEKSWAGFDASWNWQPNARASPQGPPTAADARRAFVASITGHRTRATSDDPRTIDVDISQPDPPRIAAGCG
jgi:hypothetical protein